jgi:hypothetical protein
MEVMEKKRPAEIVITTPGRRQCVAVAGREEIGASSTCANVGLQRQRRDDVSGKAESPLYRDSSGATSHLIRDLLSFFPAVPLAARAMSWQRPKKK